MISTMRIIPKDPLIARDGRPFSFGNRMHSLDWPKPSTVAGSLRTMIGKLAGGSFDKKMVGGLKTMTILGSLPLESSSNGDFLFFPAPKDILVQKDNAAEKKGPFMLRPRRVGDRCGSSCGTDLGEEEYLPFMEPEPEESFKPGKIPPFWRSDLMLKWLLAQDVASMPKIDPKDENYKAKGSSPFKDFPRKEDRVHVSIDPQKGTSEDGMLFSTTGLDMREPGMSMSLRVKCETYGEIIGDLSEHHPLGGERRLARWDRSKDEALWCCPDEIRAALEELRPGDGIRMVLGTSAVFEKGWLPGWLDDDKKGKIPGTSVEVRLISAVTSRWEPLSGWSYETKRPKPLSRMVPAGSVYFLELLSGNASELAEVWLEPVSDEKLYKNDGYGLALWGLWK